MMPPSTRSTLKYIDIEDKGSAWSTWPLARRLIPLDLQAGSMVPWPGHVDFVARAPDASPGAVFLLSEARPRRRALPRRSRSRQGAHVRHVDRRGWGRAEVGMTGSRLQGTGRGAGSGAFIYRRVRPSWN